MDFKLEHMSVDFLFPHEKYEDSIARRIELCGRTAYRSEDKITAESSLDFCERMIRHGHHSVLEHGNIVLSMRPVDADMLLQCLGPAHVWFHKSMRPYRDICVAANVRAWRDQVAQRHSLPVWALVENTLTDVYPHLFEKNTNVFHQEYLGWADQAVDSDLMLWTARIRCDRGLTHELVRHRLFSFTQESTRYVNYDNNVPGFYKRDPLDAHYVEHVSDCVNRYKAALDRGETPQEARDYLPNALMATIMVSGYLSQWKYFIALRSGKGAHPRIQELSKMCAIELDVMGANV